MIRFERQAHSGGYLGKDIHGNTGPLEGDKVFQTTWNVENLSAEIRDMGFEVLPLCELTDKSMSRHLMMQADIYASIYTTLA